MADRLKDKAIFVTGAGLIGAAWDVAHAAVFLASDESRYITVGGGLTLKIK